MRAVSVMERLVASVDARPSIRPRLSGTGVHGSVNASDCHPHGSVQENESERVKGVENWSDYEKLVREDVPKILRSKEGEGCANVNVNEGGNVRLNVSESVISRSGNECVNGQNVNDCDRGDHANAHARDDHDRRRR